MYKMKSDINFSLTHEMLENAENERIHTSYAQEKAILECVSNGEGEIGRRMRRFSKKYPEVRYEISEGNTYELLEMLRQGRIEVALARTPFPTEGLSCVYLEAEPMMAVGEASYFMKLYLLLLP